MDEKVDGETTSGNHELEDRISDIRASLRELEARSLPTEVHEAVCLANEALAVAWWITAFGGHNPRVVAISVDGQSRSPTSNVRGRVPPRTLVEQARMALAEQLTLGERQRNLLSQLSWIASDEGFEEGHAEEILAHSIGHALFPAVATTSDRVDIAARLLRAWRLPNEALRWKRVNECLSEIGIASDSGTALKRAWSPSRSGRSRKSTRESRT